MLVLLLRHVLSAEQLPLARGVESRQAKAEEAVGAEQWQQQQVVFAAVGVAHCWVEAEIKDPGFVYYVFA